jgi:hypothetical protein
MHPAPAAPPLRPRCLPPSPLTPTTPPHRTRCPHRVPCLTLPAAFQLSSELGSDRWDAGNDPAWAASWAEKHLGICYRYRVPNGPELLTVLQAAFTDVALAGLVQLKESSPVPPGGWDADSFTEAFLCTFGSQVRGALG